MKHDAIKRWTKGLHIGALLCWVCILAMGLVIAMTQAECSTVQGFGHLVNGIGEDIKTVSEGTQRHLAGN